MSSRSPKTSTVLSVACRNSGYSSKVFVPDNVKVPEPALVKLPDPLITPETVSFPLSPVVNVAPFASSTLPAPCSELIVSVASTS